MKKILSHTLIVVSLLSIVVACGSSNNEKGEKLRDEYSKSLNDSILNLQSEIDSCNNNIEILRDQVGVLLRDFVTVPGPRNVGSYIIMDKFKNNYPLNATGITARINDSGQFELIAALSARPFNQIAVKAPDVDITSQVVKKDQAMNYESGALTTVCFIGERADSVGMVIADNQLNPLTLVYLNGSPIYEYRINGNESEMVAYTYTLYKTQQDLNITERRVSLLNEKMKVLRSHLDK